MIFFNTILNVIFTFYLLLHPLLASSDVVAPFEDKSLPEAKQLNELYLSPMVTIKNLLRNAKQNCSRLPSEKEFKDFILNGGHEHIRCSKKITNINVQIPEFGQLIGKHLPYLPEFLNRNQYQVYSDTKTIYVILKHKPSEWKYKYFKAEEYEFVIHCTIGMDNCNLDKIKNSANSCRASETMAQYCYFNGKKIIDY